MRRTILAALVVATTLAGGVASAEVIFLKDGTQVEGKLRASRPGTVEVAGTHTSQRMNRRDVLRIEHAVALRSPSPLTRASDQSRLFALAHAVEGAYLMGRPKLASELLGTSPTAFSWEQAGADVQIKCKYNGQRMQVRVTRRPGVEGPLAVAFPPGTYGKDEDDDRRYQDLVLLRAPVVVLGERDRVATETVPVACARYGWSTPTFQLGYTLERFERGSDMDRLLTVLCSGEQLAPEAETQLAVWTLRNGLTRTQFREAYTTFETSRPIRRHHSQGAAELLERSGVRLDELPFFRAAPERPSEAPPQPVRRPQERSPELIDISFQS